MNLEFKNIDGPSNDGTCVYNVVFDGEITVQEFIQHVLFSRDDKWVKFAVNVVSRPYKQKDVIYEYRNGETVVTNKELYTNMAGKTITHIKAVGCYFHMDYVLLTESKDLVLSRERIEELETELSLSQEKNRGLIEIIGEKDLLIKDLKQQNVLLHKKIVQRMLGRKWYKALFKKND